jgi:hypothetical protein
MAPSFVHPNNCSTIEASNDFGIDGCDEQDAVVDERQVLAQLKALVRSISSTVPSA